jgi:hypothetical protein
MLCCHLRDLSCSIQNDCHQNLQLATVPNISQMFRLLPELDVFDVDGKGLVFVSYRSSKASFRHVCIAEIYSSGPA